MQWITSLFGGGVSKAVDSVGNALDNLFTSDEERLEAQRLQSEIDQRPVAAQWDINKTEAVSGKSWRHWVGRVCAIALALYFIPQYAIASVVWVKMCWNVAPVDGIYHLPAYPATVDGLMELVTGMLGLGAIKGIEVLAGKRRAK